MKKRSQKAINNELDATWASQVKTRDDNICQRCERPSKRLNAHHIIPRQYKGLRWDISNGVSLCPRCHRLGKEAAHQNALLFTEWLKTSKPDIYSYLMEKLSEEQNGN